MAKPKRYTPEQITRVLKQQDGGMKVAEICRQTGICEQTFYRWKSKYGGMGISNEAREIVEDWRQDYNHVRPHSSLEYRAPKEVVSEHQIIKNPSLTSHWACVR